MTISSQDRKVHEIADDILELSCELTENLDLMPEVNSIIKTLTLIQKTINRLEWAEINLKEAGTRIADIDASEVNRAARFIGNNPEVKLAGPDRVVNNLPENPDEINPLAHEQTK